MDEKLKDVMTADIEKVNAVEDFLSDWYSVSDLFETAANAGSVLLSLPPHIINPDDMKWLKNLIDQHVMMANVLKKFEKGDQL